MGQNAVKLDAILLQPYMIASIRPAQHILNQQYSFIADPPYWVLLSTNASVTEYCITGFDSEK